MPNFDRRGFMQFLGAAGVTPLLPALPARAVAATGASTSKALWASIYAKSGSVPKFASVARNMGLPSAAIQGVGARSVGVRIALAAAANPVGRLAGRGNTTLPSSPNNPLKAARKVLQNIDRAMPVETDETDAVETPNADTA